MLAKMWKKILLAICIVACIFNIMSKLVNRSSLESNLKNVKGESILSNFFNQENTQNQEINKTENIVTEETSNTQSTAEEVQINTNVEVTNEVQRDTTSDYVVIN